MQRNLVFVRAGDSSLHRSWVVPRAKRNYDLFISYFGSQNGRYQQDGEYYEAVPGLKLPAITRLLSEKPDLMWSYDAIWIPDDDLLTSAALINRMFELFHKHKLLLAQPALGPGSYTAHPVTAMMNGKSLHYSRFVEVMCPVFSRAALKKLAPTFSMNASSWGIDFLWAHRLGYPPRRIAVLDETPVVHTRPVGKGSFYQVLKGKGQSTDAVAESTKIINKYKIAWDITRARVYGSIDLPKGRTAATGKVASLFFLQQMVDNTSRSPIFYENRSRKLRLKDSERPDFAASRESRSGGTAAGANGDSSAGDLARLMSADERLRLIAKDFFKHWAVRQSMRHGKAMIVCADRRVGLKLYRIITRLRPEWKRQGTIQFVTDSAAAALSVERFKDPQDPLEVVITHGAGWDNFDCPVLNTLYVDLPVPVDQHVQWVRRLMHIFQNRMASLVVDYLGLSDVAFQNEPEVPRQTPAVQSQPIQAKILKPEFRRLPPLPSVQERTTAPGTELPRPRASAATGRTPRIAHLFLIRNNLNHEGIWQAFFRGNENYYNLYVHAKQPEETTSELLRDRHIARRCETAYGHISLVKAELLLLREAFRNKQNQFFLLHSESCVPIRSFGDVYQQMFETGRTWMYSFKGDMWRYYGVEMSAIPHACFFKASQFFCLTRSHAEFVLAEGKLRQWQHCNCADEHYIPSVLAMGEKLHECVQRPLTFTEWNRKRRESPAGPTTFHRLSAPDLESLRRSESLFARKFAPDSDISRHIKMLHSRVRRETFGGEIQPTPGPRPGPAVRRPAALMRA